MPVVSEASIPHLYCLIPKECGNAAAANEARVHKRVVDPERPKGAKGKGLRGENGAVNCRTRSGRTQNQAKRKGALASGETKLRTARRNRRALDLGSSAPLRQ